MISVGKHLKLLNSTEKLQIMLPGNTREKSNLQTTSKLQSQMNIPSNSLSIKDTGSGLVKEKTENLNSTLMVEM